MNVNKFGLFVGLLILMASCQETAEKSVLARPPFAGITDSIEKFPDDVNLLLKRAELLSQHDLHELAYDDYKLAWEKQPNEETAQAYVSNLYLVNKPKTAVEVLQKASQQFPDNPEFRRRLSEAYLESGLSSKALEEYNSILAVDSTNFEAWYEKGLLLAQMKDTSAAILALERSYALQPLSINGIPLASLYAETRNPGTVTICDEIIMKDSTGSSLDPYFLKGIYYSNTAQYKQALEQFDICVNLDWKFTDAYIEKGIVLFDLKNIDEAMQTFKRAATISPRSADAWYWLGRCYETLNKQEEALDNYIRAYALDRSFKEAKERIEKLKN